MHFIVDIDSNKTNNNLSSLNINKLFYFLRMAQYFERIILYVSPNLQALVAQNMNRAIHGIRH